MMENTTCGLTRAELDAHPTWITAEGRCLALRPDGTQCKCTYSAHLSPAPALGNYLHAVYFIVLVSSHILHICILFAFDVFHLMV